MKISNETKIGALTAIAVVFLILGFNFLKGKSVLKTGFFLYAKYTDIKKLGASNAVYANGYQIGTVYAAEAANPNLSQIIVELKLNSEYNIPDNSFAIIESNPLGSPAISINLGNSTSFLHSGDTMRTSESSGMFGELTDKLGPVADKVTVTLSSLDSLLKNFNSILDTSAKGNLHEVFNNLSNLTASLAKSSVNLERMLNEQNGVLGHTLKNVDSFTNTLASNSYRINSILANVDTTTGKLSRTNFDSLVAKFNASADKLNAAMDKLNSKDNSVGALINDRELYENINSTIRSLNILADDLRAHPKRYVDISVSVFGKKDKGSVYLTDTLQKK